jgi:hypothetical protein
VGFGFELVGRDAGDQSGGDQSGTLTPVVISDPTGSTYEVITGGGTAAGFAETGLVSLVGSYGVGGTLSVGMPETLSKTTSTSGSVSLSTGSSLSVGAITLNSGTIALAGTGAGLTTSGSVTMGLASGAVLPSGTSYAFDNGAIGVGAGASFVASGSAVVADGSISFASLRDSSSTGMSPSG